MGLGARNLFRIRLLVALLSHIFVISLRFSNVIYCGKVDDVMCAEQIRGVPRKR